MKKHDLLEQDVDLKELASLTKNFSGAEIAGMSLNELLSQNYY